MKYDRAAILRSAHARARQRLADATARAALAVAMLSQRGEIDVAR